MLGPFCSPVLLCVRAGNAGELIRGTVGSAWERVVLCGILFVIRLRYLFKHLNFLDVIYNISLSIYIIYYM